MSFSGKVKEELLEHYARARHCDIAELSAIVHMAGEFKVGHGGVCCLKVHTENLGVARKCFTLLVKTFNIKTDVVVRRNTGKDNYSYYIYAKGEELLAIRDTIVQAVCCKRACWCSRHAVREHLSVEHLWQRDRSVIRINPIILKLSAMMRIRQNI